MPVSLALPREDASLERYELTGVPLARPSAVPAFNRIAYAAAHEIGRAHV